MGDIDKLYSQASIVLGDQEETPEERFLLQLVERLSLALCMVGDTFEPEEIKTTVGRLQESFDVKMKLGTLFESDDYKPWLKEKQAEIKWLYWERYRDLLLARELPHHVVRSIPVYIGPGRRG